MSKVQISLLAKLSVMLSFAVSTGSSQTTGGCQMTSNGDFTCPGAIAAAAINQIQKADQFPGSTADAKINACLAAAGNGVCDASGLTGTQTVAATVTVGSGGLNQVLILSPTTNYLPGNSIPPDPMFSIKANGAISGLWVQIPAGQTYAGRVLDVEDTINNNTFSIDHVRIVGTGGGYGLYMQPPAGGYISLVNVNDVTLKSLGTCMYLGATGTSGTTYINGVNFNNIQLDCGGNTDLAINPRNVQTSEINSNTFSNIQLEGSGTELLMEGAGPIEGNIFSPVFFWDSPNPVSNTNSATCILTNPGATGACTNVFMGGSSFSVTTAMDPLSADSAWPNQNIYWLNNDNFGTTFRGAPFDQLSVSGTHPWPGGPQKRGTFAWSTSGNLETDYFTGQLDPTPVHYSHKFFLPNSSSSPTGFCGIGGWLANGDFQIGDASCSSLNTQLAFENPLSAGAPLIRINWLGTNWAGIGLARSADGGNPATDVEVGVAAQIGSEWTWTGSAVNWLVTGAYKNKNGILIPGTAAGNTGDNSAGASGLVVLAQTCTTASITPSASAGGTAAGSCTITDSATGHAGIAAATDGSVQGNVIPQVSIDGTTANVTLTTIIAGSVSAKSYNVTVF
ncbi:MAG: hypothetical protein WBE03_05900 [Terracidiphilus sp.]